jgi:P4 family phage/plasmid primase-like protien
LLKAKSGFQHSVWYSRQNPSSYSQETVAKNPLKDHQNKYFNQLPSPPFLLYQVHLKIEFYFLFTFNKNNSNQTFTMAMTYFKSKAAALKRAQSNQIVCNRAITQYFVMDSYEDFLQFILDNDLKDFYELICNEFNVKPFFDIEMYKDQSHFFEDAQKVVRMCIDKIKDLLPDNWNMTNIVLQSHSDIKKSFHVIVCITDENGNHVMLQNVSHMKKLFKHLGFDKIKDNDNKHIIDPSVYREGLFRTIHSTKNNENRPLVKSDLSDDFEDIESFVTFTTFNKTVLSFDQFISLKTPSTTITEIDQSADVDDADIITLGVSPPHDESSARGSAIPPANAEDMPVNIPEELKSEDKENIIKFIHCHFHIAPNKVRDVLVDSSLNCIIVALTERYCEFAEKEHRSNNQYIVIDTFSAKQKCHDTECNDKKHNEIKIADYTPEISDIIKRCLKVNRAELELINKSIAECRQYIADTFNDTPDNVSFDRNEMVFRGNVNNSNLTRLIQGTCPECNVEHRINDNGYCLLCTRCRSVFPRNQLIPVDRENYGTLAAFWNNYSQLNNHGTINNIINIYNGTDIEFSCDIKLDNNILRNREVTEIVNQILDGHKITMFSKLMSLISKRFVYSKGQWYQFNGSIWRHDNDCIEMKKEIIESAKIFNKIKAYYDARSSTGDASVAQALGKNIRGLIIKINKPSFQDEIIKGAKMYYNDELFLSLLNSKKHLVPFNNGVFDLITHAFRSTTKDDHVNLTTFYNFDPSVHNPDVYKFLEQVLPNEAVRDFILKKMSECLNGDIPNTHFLMLIGDTGANGKSQLLNLMKHTMGEFGEKVEVTLLTRRRNNANEANTEKIKLMNKRFAFLSEPEDGEKINIGLLKELTGSEEIVARGLYQDSVSFVMEAKLFLACNELPEIKGEDTALWRRIRVVDFPSRFVDDPKGPNEYKIDRSLPSRMREDVTWRQTFMNILLSYYQRDIQEPEEVKVKTNEYRQENNDFENWFNENVERNDNGLLKLKDVCAVCDLIQTGNNKKVHSKTASKYKNQINAIVAAHYPKEVQFKDSTMDGKRYAGWIGLQLKQQEFE